MSNQIKTFASPVFKDLQKAITDALNKVASHYGITITAFNTIEFSNDYFSTKLEACIGDEKAKWNKDAWAYGLSNNDFGKTFIHNDAGYTIVGIEPKTPNFPVIVMNHLDDKKYNMSVALIRTALND
jgi:hypothetical protein